MRRYTDKEIRNFVSKPLFDPDILLKKDPAYPKISVITPNYNKAEFLERTILSVLNQNYPNLEYIIIDDGSTDDSLGVIKKYEKYLIASVGNKNQGQSAALNKGFERATGEIIGWQNSDDIYLEDAFRKAIQYFKRYPWVEVIYGDRLGIDEKDQINGAEIRFTKFSRIIYQYDGISVSNQSAFWKKQVFDKIGMLDPKLKFSMDYEFYLRAAVKGIKFKYVHDCFGAARRYPTNRTDVFIGTPPFKAELDSIDERHGRKKWLNLPLKIYSLIYRIINYALQGDLDYVMRGPMRRLKSGKKYYLPWQKS